MLKKLLDLKTWNGLIYFIFTMFMRFSRAVYNQLFELVSPKRLMFLRLQHDFDSKGYITESVHSDTDFLAIEEKDNLYYFYGT